MVVESDKVPLWSKSGEEKKKEMEPPKAASLNGLLERYKSRIDSVMWWLRLGIIATDTIIPYRNCYLLNQLINVK